MTMRILLLVVLWGLSPLSVGEEAELSIDSINSALEHIEQGLGSDYVLRRNIDSYLEQLPRYAVWAKACIADAEKEITTIENQLGILGGAVYDEAHEAKSFRETLLNKKSEASTVLASCKVILVRDELAIQEISEFRKNNLQRESLVRGINIFQAISQSITQSHQWVNEIVQISVSRQGIKNIAGDQKLMLLAIIGFSVVLGLMIRKGLGLTRWIGPVLARGQEQEQVDTGMRIVAALAMTTRHYIIPILLSFSVGLFISIETFDQVPKPLLTIVLDVLPVLISVFALTYFVYYALPELGLRRDLDRSIARSLQIRVNILASTWFLGYLLTQTILANSLPDSALFIVRAIFGLIICLNVIWIIWQSHNTKGIELTRPILIISSLMLIATLIAEFAGYRNLASLTLQGVVGSLVFYALFQLLYNLSNRLLNDLNEGKSAWQQGLRKSIGADDTDSFPGFIWLKLVVAVSVWLSFIIALLWVWRVPKSDVQLLISKFTLGFSVGSIEIVPARLFEAVIVLILLLAINGWFQRVLENSWLKAGNIAQGAQDSISIISNYVGIGVAIIVALGIAGMDFSKLAIVAGALSVGIGFGMRDIVNNFISGLILLFERPIKKGDWISATGVEGRVKKISIRSTEIESFDRADIIVPNSVLISDNLTNWVHKNRFGRLRIPIGVAYGSDTEKVRDILVEIARKHPAVLIGYPTMDDPKVLFLAFGDSSLNFELRFFVRDILSRMDIQSEINFSIDKTFRENNIQIPFPQRDVHLYETEKAQAEPNVVNASPTDTDPDSTSK